MKNELYPVLLLMVALLLCAATAKGQTARDTLTGHDVIVLQNGQMLRGKVLEIGLEQLRYKRAGYLNGPTYTVALSAVFAVNYPDGQSDYFSEAADFQDEKQKEQKSSKKDKKDAENLLFKHSSVSLGAGIFKQQSRGDDLLESPRQTNDAPAIALRYFTSWRGQLAFGLEAGTMSYRFTGDQAETYDNAIVTGDVREQVYALTAFARYALTTKPLTPYAMGGIGLVTSSIDSELSVILLDSGVNYQLGSGANDTRLGITLRAGLSYQLSDQIQLYADAGAGLAILQIGTTLVIN